VCFGSRVDSSAGGPSTRGRGRTLAEVFESPVAREGHYKPLGRAELLKYDDRSLQLKVTSTTVEVAALAPDLFRIGMFPEGRMPDYKSEAIASEGRESVGARIRAANGTLTLSTRSATVHVTLDPLRVRCTDASGQSLPPTTHNSAWASSSGRRQAS
jgi:alpha-glucosidase